MLEKWVSFWLKHRMKNVRNMLVQEIIVGVLEKQVLQSQRKASVGNK